MEGWSRSGWDQRALATSLGRVVVLMTPPQRIAWERLSHGRPANIHPPHFQEGFDMGLKLGGMVDEEHGRNHGADVGSELYRRGLGPDSGALGQGRSGVSYGHRAGCSACFQIEC